jgi:hypothetical protein
MTQQIPFSNSKFNKGISPEQLNQIVEAILGGKYSWACVLLLRYAGYNPLHYIPYRTYNRLLKENSQAGIPSGHETNNIKPDIQCSETRSNNAPLQQHTSKLTDLDYLEAINEQHPQVRGGNLAQTLESNSLKIKWLLPKSQGFSEFN